GSEFRDTGSRTDAGTDTSLGGFKQTQIAESDDPASATRRAASAATLPDSAAGGAKAPAPSTSTPLVAQPVPSPRRGGWKIYAGVAALLVIVVGVPLAVIKAKSGSSTQPVVQVEPSPDSSGQSPANSLSSNPAPPVAETGDKPPGVAENSAVDPNSNSKSKNAHLDKNDPGSDPNANVNGAGSTVTAKPNPNSSVASQASNSNAAVSHKDSNAVASSNSNTNKNEKKKGGGIGGFFKKVFGGNDEKKPETQKQNDKKKPRHPTIINPATSA